MIVNPKIKNMKKYFGCFILFLFACQATSRLSPNISETALLKRLEVLNGKIVKAAIKNDVAQHLSVFHQAPISMSEHQVSMQGVEHLQQYYQTIFERQNLSTYQRKTTKIYPIDSRIIEIGTFRKEGVMTANQTPFSHQGKYMNLWILDDSNQLKLAVETWNYDQPVEDVTSLLVDIPPAEQHGVFKTKRALTLAQTDAIKAAQVIMKRGVQRRDGPMRAALYHQDAVFMPHDEPMMIGGAQILEHLIDYNAGDVIIDNVEVGVNWSENLGDYILQSSNYYVEWRVDNYSGIGKGKGLRMWKKTADGSLKILVQIALRDHIE